MKTIKYQRSYSYKTLENGRASYVHGWTDFKFSQEPFTKRNVQAQCNQQSGNAVMSIFI